MFDKNAFANAAAILSGVAYVVAYIFGIVAPTAFSYWFDAQFFGAEISKSLSTQPIPNALGILVTLFLTSWVVGYLFAALYNNFRK